MESVCMNCPLGLIEIVASDGAIVRISFCDEAPAEASFFTTDALLLEAVSQINAYFAGESKVFALPLEPEGTEFQRRVWDELLRIPFGVTVSYLEMARRLGDEKCIRAAAAANGRNPIGLIIPCHRVIGSNGKLVGYAGGLWRKQKLLQHEMQFVKAPGTLF